MFPNIAQFNILDGVISHPIRVFAMLKNIFLLKPPFSLKFSYSF